MEQKNSGHQSLRNDPIFRISDFHDIKECVIITTDKEGKISSWNIGASEAFGYSYEEINDHPLGAILRPSGNNREETLWDHFRKRSTPGSEELTGVHKDGHRVHLLLAFLPIMGENGGDSGLIFLGKDVTSSKRAEEILRTSEMRYRRLFEAARDGVLIIDPASGRIIDANPCMIEMVGFTKDELIDKLFWEISPPEYNDPGKTRFKELLERGYIRYDDIPRLSKDRRLIDVEFVSNAYLVQDTRVIQSNIRDITERKKAENALRQSEEKLMEQNNLLEQKNAALREIMSQHQSEKERIESQVQANVDHLLRPVIEKLKGTGNSLVDRYIELLEAAMNEITSRFGNSISSRMLSLTQREIDICNMIKNGFSSKQISQALHISTRTIETHRNSIRKKLDISGKKVNLATYLKSL
jgi:PAS domain S-box-containing protein